MSRCHGHRVRLLAVVAAVALGAQACAWLPVFRADPTSRDGQLSITAPVNRSHSYGAGPVAVAVDFGPKVEESTFRAWVRTGLPSHKVEITDSFTVDADGATASLGDDLLAEGVTLLEVRARTNRGFQRASTAFSWEPAVDLANADRCDFLEQADCLLPFPNDHFTTPDAETDTGKRVEFAPASMPTNAANVPIDPTEWNRNDGFSPGASGLLHLPEVDLVQTGAAPITDIQQSLAPGAPIVMVDADTRQRVPLWVEQDSTATGPGDQALMIRPAVALEEGHRYVVALRRLRDGSGQPITAERAFALYRDRSPTFAPEVESRRDHFEDIFRTLHRSAIARHDLYLAWDFTVASERNLSERMLHMRDDAFAALGDDSPEFDVTEVVEDPFGATSGIARRVTGTFDIPLYLDQDGVPGSVLVYGADGLPERQGTYTADFTCIVPRTAAGQTSTPEPGRAVLYGHGIFGSHTQVTNGRWQAQAATYNMVVCGATWIGASDDIPTVLANFQDLSRVKNQPDRTQQGMLNFLFLGRLMKHDAGLVSDPAFQTSAGDPVVDTSDLFFTGQSQGALLGGATTAFAQDWTRAVLTAPSMNANVVLRRSTQGPQFVGIIKGSYSGDLEATLALNLIQMLVDRGETNGFSHHLTDDPYPNTPAHHVLLQAAFGDFQTTTISPEIMARTTGMPVHRPVLDGDPFYQVDPYYGLPALAYPSTGSALVVYDYGNPAPPEGNVPPSGPPGDPHGKPSNQPEAQAQLSSFFDGSLVNVCSVGPCRFDF